MGGHCHSGISFNYWFTGTRWTAGIAQSSFVPSAGAHRYTDPYHIPFAFNSVATISRIWLDDTRSNGDPHGFNPNPHIKITGFLNHNDMYNLTNGIVMLEITGRGWLNQWYPMTTPATVSHIRFEQLNSRSNINSDYFGQIVWGH